MTDAVPGAPAAPDPPTDPPAPDHPGAGRTTPPTPGSGPSPGPGVGDAPELLRPAAYPGPGHQPGIGYATGLGPPLDTARPTWAAPGVLGPTGYGGPRSGVDAFAPAPGYGQPGTVPGTAYGPPATGYGQPPTPVSPSGQPLASFPERLGAFLIDNLIVTGILMVPLIPTMFVVMFAVLPDAGNDPYAPYDPYARPPGPAGAEFLRLMLIMMLLWAFFMAVHFLAFYLYSVEVTLRRGQTVGKRVLKIKIVPLAPGQPLTRRALTRRYLVQYVAGALIPLFSYLDGLWQLWDKPYQQCLHDRFAGTVVVKVPAP